jgi:hypothetical protein
MRIFILTTCLFVSFFSFSQQNKIVQHKNAIDRALKNWKQTFTNFNLTDFKAIDTIKFENSNKQDFNSYKKFTKIYSPIITYSEDSTKFIDIYSYQLGLEKAGNHYKTNIEVDQVIFLYDKNKKYWNRIYFLGTTNNWIDEVIWVSKTEFLLFGIIKNEQEQRLPMIMLGDTEKQKLFVYETKNCFQNKRYSSPKLKKMKIVGL